MFDWRIGLICLAEAAMLPCASYAEADRPLMTGTESSFDAPGFSGLFEQLKTTVSRHRRAWRRQGRTFHVNHPWVRDNIHQMKAFKYWDDDPAGFIDMLLELQHPDGFFYEIIGRADHDHLPLVGPKHRRVEPEENLAWIRLELEPDIEYLMVEAAHTIWQATGDEQATRRRLPHLERGLRYLMTDPTRWDAEHGAVKRTFTIDTWDFTYGIPDSNRRIEPGMPMGIMHGDNSGLYQACRQLARMYRATGQAPRADEWDRTADELRGRINRLCFNGRYYTHQLLLQPIDTGVNEDDILSLSNVYDINRGLPTHDMAVRIIDEYQRRRELRAETHFAEWFSIDPPYPQFGPYPAGRYINGGIASFVAGELARAAFEHGREAYGADILKRLAGKVAEDGAIHFLYTAEGRDQGGGPSGWGAAAMISALIEGLAGIRDDDVLFRRVTVSPRFVAANIDRASVCARYAAGGAGVALNFEHDPPLRTIRLRLAGASLQTHVRVLLPGGVSEAEVVSPASVPSIIEVVEQSHYLVFDLPKPLGEGPAGVTIRYWGK